MQKNKGFILVSVMIAAVTLLTTATAFAWFAHSEAKSEAIQERIYRFRNIAEIASNIISRRIAEDANGYDSFTERLYNPQEHVEIIIGDYTAEVQIHPLNDKIPLQGILLPDGVTLRSEYEAAWKNIWEALELPYLMNAVIDFIDENTEQMIGSAERDININRMVSDLSELLVVPDITKGILYGTDEIPVGLNEYVTILDTEKLNINTVSPEVIAILDDSLTLSHARNIAEYRLVNPIRELEDLKNIPSFPPELVTKLGNILAVESTHFRLDIKVSDKAGSVRNYRMTVTRSTEVQD